MENIRRLPLGWQGAVDEGVDQGVRALETDTVERIKGSEPLKRTPLKINHIGFQGL
jgi:hypothetical protein